MISSVLVGYVFFFFFLRESFNLWRLLLIVTLYYQTKTPISFWCRWGLNPRSLIQPSEILPVELTGTHDIGYVFFLTGFLFFCFYLNNADVENCGKVKCFSYIYIDNNNNVGLRAQNHALGLGFCSGRFGWSEEEQVVIRNPNLKSHK